MMENFEKAKQLLGVIVPMHSGKKTKGDGGELAVGTSVKLAGSNPKKTLSFRGRCDGLWRKWAQEARLSETVRTWRRPRSEKISAVSGWHSHQ